MLHSKSVKWSIPLLLILFSMYMLSVRNEAEVAHPSGGETDQETLTQQEQQLLYCAKANTMHWPQKNSALPIVKSFPSPTPYPRGMAYDGRYFYIIQMSGSDKIYVVDPATGGVVEDFEWILSKFPIGIGWDGTHFYVSDDTYPMIRVLDANFIITKEYPAPDTWQRDFAFDGVNLLEATSSLPKIWFLGKKNGAVMDSFDPPRDRPGGLAWDGEYIWLSNTDIIGSDDYVYKLDVEGNIIEEYHMPGYYLTGLAFDGEYLWGVDWENDQIYQFDIGLSTPE